jgi:transcriptional regulator with XRE-family HTH domain
MQTSSRRRSPLNDEVSRTFAERAKAARLRAGLTQQQLCDRLEEEAEVELDTSAITRIEAGQREPRLGEALAIARVLGFGLDNLVPRAELDVYLSDVKRLMDESRAALVTMLRSVDPIVDFVRGNPDHLGDDRLEDRFHEVIEWFHRRVSHEDFGHGDQGPLNFAVTTNRTDEKLKRQLLRAVSDEILVRADEIQPAYDRWFKEDAGQDRRKRRGASTTGSRMAVSGDAGVDLPQWRR